MAIENTGYADNSKRSKLLLLSFLCSATIFVLKLLQVKELTLLQVYLVAIGGFVMSYAGLIVSFNFAVNKKALLVYIPQAAFFVFTEILFLELYFFSKFDRIYEAVILLSLIFLFFLGSYAVFLMANVFTVSSFKPIPLEQVAKTTSYILTTLIIYFYTFAIIASGFNIIIMLLLLIAGYALISGFHLLHIGLPDKVFIRYLGASVFCMLTISFGIMFAGRFPELISLVPAVTFYCVTGAFIKFFQKALSFPQVIQYILLIASVIVINVIR